MAKSSMPAQQASPVRTANCRAVLFGAALALLILMLTACAVEVENRRPAREYAYQRSSPNQAAVYTGWRLFQERCASCHGPAALGTSRAPNLLPRVSTMDQRRFIVHVLYRYQWGFPEVNVGRDALDQLIEDIQNRQKGELTMPAFGSEPRVNAHIADLFTYLSARADGSQGPWRPFY